MKELLKTLDKNSIALYNKWVKRPYSWSQHASYEYSPEQWFDSYVLGIWRSSSSMEFGNIVGQKLATDINYLPEVPRQPHMEYPVRTKLGQLHVVGYFDSYNWETRMLEEYKTSSNVNKWNQKSVHEHGQLTFYCMLLFLDEKISPESITIRLHYIPVSTDSFFNMFISGKVKSFETSRTTKQVFELMVEINKRRKEMEEYAIKKLLNKVIHK